MSNEISTLTDVSKGNNVVDFNPYHLVNIAINQGADIDKLEKLLDLQDRWEKAKSKKDFDQAISVFQSEMPVIKKRGNVDYTSSKGRTYYEYGRLEDAVRIASPRLKEAGLSFRFNQNAQQGGVITVTCIISHKNGHSESNSMSALPDASGHKDPIKAMASTVSYLRRYTFTAGLGIIFSDEDDENPDNNNYYDSNIIDVESVIIDFIKKQGKTDSQFFEWVSKQYKREVLSFDDLKEEEKQAIAKRLQAK